MVRRVFAQRKVLDLYRGIKEIRYPICPVDFLPLLPIDSRVMSYQELAKISGGTVRDVVILCNSNTGATQYDRDNEQCLILYNDLGNPGRCLWTICHEIGHISMGYLGLIDSTEIAEGETRAQYKLLELEADYFAWNLIAPLPIMRAMGIENSAEIKRVFGLSSQAAAFHFDRYLKWCHSHNKTSWENDLLREFFRKYKM